MIYLVMRHTGQYSDYRCNALFYSDDESLAQSYCEKAQEIARHLDEKAEKIMEGLDYDDDLLAYERAERKRAKLKSPFDANLDHYEFSDVRYTVEGVNKMEMPS